MARRPRHRAKQNSSVSTLPSMKSLIAHTWIWAGAGMLIRGGYFGPFWNPGLGMLSIAYGLYDLSKPRPEATGTAEEPSPDFHLFPDESDKG